MTLYGYARVSVREPEDKNLDLQVERLVRAGCSLGNIRAEEASGARNDRGGLLELLGLVVEGDTLVVTHIDRLSRGLTHGLQAIEGLRRKEYEDQLTILKDEGLLNWAGDPVESPDYDGWVEYRECLVLSSGWDGIIHQMPELFDELRPRNRASISLRGGLSAGRRDTWLEGYLPCFFITSFDPTWRVAVTNLSLLDAEPAMDRPGGEGRVVFLRVFPPQLRRRADGCGYARVQCRFSTNAPSGRECGGTGVPVGHSPEWGRLLLVAGATRQLRGGAASGRYQEEG